LGVKADGGVLLPCVEKFRPQTHDRVCALLKVLVSHGYIQDGKLGLLIAFGRAIEEMDDTVFFQGNGAQPGREWTAVCCPVIAVGRRDGARNRVGIARASVRAGRRAGITRTVAAAKENYYR
jgi:hypothetical protein